MLILASGLAFLPAESAQAQLPTTDLVLRYETVGAIPYTLTGSRVSSWKDQTGTASDANELGISGPTLVAGDTPGGQAALDFNAAATNYLQTGALAEFASRSNVSWFIVFKANGWRANEQYILRTLDNGGTARTRWGTATVTNTTSTNLSTFTRNSGNTTISIQTGFRDTANWHILGTVWNGTTGPMEAWLDGVSVGTASAVAANVGIANLRIGASSHVTPPSFYWHGRIAAILVYTNVLNAADRVAVESYLAQTYLGIAAPVAIQDPQSSTNSTGDTLTLTGVFTNSPTSYQWFKDGEPIPGATGSSYTIPFVTLLDAGSYFLRAMNWAGSNDTASATLTVLPDSTAPTVARASISALSSRVRVRFSEPVATNAATTLGNYVFDDAALSLASASMVDRFTVDLFTTTAPVSGSNYVVRISSVLDYAGNEIQANTPVSLSVSSLPLMNQLVAAFDGYSAVPSPVDGVNWLDRSGNENHASNTVATAGRRPTLLSAAFNGHPTLKFVRGSSQTLSIDAATGVGLGGSNHTWFFVVKPTYLASAINVVRHRSSLNNANWGSFFFEGNATTGNQPALTANGRTTAGGAVEARAYPVTLGSWVIGSGFLDAAAGNVHSRVESPAEGTSNAANDTSGTATGMGTPISTWIGSVNNGTFFDGEMAEVLIYTNALSADDRALVEGYLRAKYFSAPQVVQGPASASRVTGESVTFSAVFTNATTYQWFKDGAPIADATNASLTLSYVTVLDTGEYVARGTNAAGYADTAPAELIVTDAAAPTVIGASASVFASRIRIHFSEPVETNSALTLTNYIIEGGRLTITNAAMADRFTVDLLTDPVPVPGSTYVVRVSFVVDHAGFPVAENSPASATLAVLPVQPWLIAAFDGSSATPHPLDGVNWLDRSGNENHAVNTETNANRRPTLVPNSLKAQATLQFVKTNLQSLNIPAATGTGFGGSNYTWFFVVKPTLVGLPANVIRHQSSLHNANWGSWFDGNPALLSANGRTPAPAFVGTSVGLVASNVWIIGEGYLDGTAGNVYVRMEDPAAGTSTNATNTAGTATGIGAPIATWIGFYSGNSTHGFDGEIAEVLLYASALDAVQRAEVEDYLRKKYFNQPPVAPNTNAQGVEGQILAFPLGKLLALASDPDGDPLTVVSAGPTSTNGATVTLTSSNILYQAVAGFVGFDGFHYVIGDGRGGTATGFVAISLLSSNAPSLNIVSSPTLLSNGHFHVGFAGIPHYSYTVQFSTNVNGPWYWLTNLTAGTNGLFELEDPTEPPLPPTRFYRTTYP